MKVFIFDVSWSYCGGMAIAITDSYERACQLVQNKEIEHNGSTKFTFYDLDYKFGSNHKEKYDVILTKVVNTDETKEWAAINYNYA